jgi:hypothetical protein
MAAGQSPRKKKAVPKARKKKAVPKAVLPFPRPEPIWEVSIDPNAPPVDENAVLELLADMLLDLVDPDGADPGPVGPD